MRGNGGIFNLQWRRLAKIVFIKSIDLETNKNALNKILWPGLWWYNNKAHLKNTCIIKRSFTLLCFKNKKSTKKQISARGNNETKASEPRYTL